MAKLFIIGNGFDLHHGMKTSYKDYKHYLNKTNRKTTSIIFEMYPLLNNIDKCFDNNEMIDLLWSDVEGNSTFDYELWADSIDSSFDTYSKGSKSLQAQSDIKKAKKFYRDIFREWVNTISLGDKKTDIEELILPEDYFITFNYTLTLEELYNIPSNHILHIHGKIDDNNELEFGSFANDPKNVLNELNNKYFGRINKDEDLEKMISNLSKVVKNMSKNFNKNLKKLKDFVNNIEDKLSEVVIYGLCIKPKFMDEPYFEKFLFDYFKDIKWSCYYFNEKEQINQLVYFNLNNLDKNLTQLPMNDFNYDEKLFYFTSSHNLINILQSNVFYINKFNNNDLTRRNYQYDFIDSVINSIDNNINLESFLKINTTKKEELYLYSLSLYKHLDNIHNWTEYGNYGDGVAIIFNRSKLEKLIDSDNLTQFIKYGEVSYDINEKVNRIINAYNNGKDDVEKTSNLLKIYPLFNNSLYQCEKEYKIALVANENELPRTKELIYYDNNEKHVCLNFENLIDNQCIEGFVIGPNVGCYSLSLIKKLTNDRIKLHYFNFFITKKDS